MISCVIVTRDDDRELLKVSARSAVAAGASEVVIIDVGKEAHRAFACNRTRCLRDDTDCSYGDALAAGIAHARYDWIAPLEVGDAMLPEKLAQVWATATAGANCSWSGYIDAETEETRNVPLCAPGPATWRPHGVQPFRGENFSTHVYSRHLTTPEWAFYPLPTAIVQPGRASRFSGPPAVSGGTRDIAPLCDVEQEHA